MFVACSSQWSHIVNKVKQAEQFGNSLPLFCQNHPHEDGVQVTTSADFARAPDGGCQIPCGFILPCGHSCRLACHPMDRQHTAYKCKTVCTETCPNGHPCNKPCHLGKLCNCQKMMKKPLHCGHVKTVLCREFSEVCVCSVFVKKVLPCGHQAEMKCHADPARNSCEVLVTKKRVDCGHTAKLPCSNVKIDFKCQQKVSLVRGACGHRYQIACHEDSKTYQRGNLCQELVTKTFLCMHVEDVMCCGSRYANCKTPCALQCHHGHSCGKLCHFQTPCKCEFLVEKTLPKCGHQLMIECHSEDDPAWLQVPCEEIVSKVIPLCGHSQNIKCKEVPQTQQCQEIVPKKHPLCGHMIAIMCSLTPSHSMLCKTIVHKTLVCGHKQVQECSARNVTCTVNVLKTMPCGHQQLVPCNKMDAPVTCMKRITKKFPKCGHVTEMFCWASALYLHCLQTITLTKCGHQKTISCEESMHGVEMEKADRLYKCKLTCFTEVTLHFACGHSKTTQCHLSETVRQCSKGCCPHILSCGHPCTGKDDDCSEKLFHAYCTQPCNKLLVCGHQCKSATCGLCSICSNECERYCPHRKCEHPCSQDCPPCKETCSLQCPHHNCSRLCHEECNRPPCNLRCPLMLKCSHPCMGYCGEPCPRLCIVCEPDRRNEFTQTCNEDIRLVRLLDCGHEHDASLLDKLLKEDTENGFSVLRCPSCDKVIHWHPRYSHQLKQQWHAIDAVKKILLSCLKGCTKHQRFPMVAGGVSDIRTYLRRLSTFLYLNENLNADKNRHIKSQEWLRYTIQKIRNQIASKKAKDKEGNTRRRQESRQQLEQSTGLEPYAATLGELTAGPERSQSQFLSQLGVKRQTVKNRYLGTEDNDLPETKNNLGRGDFDLRETEGNWGTGYVGTRVADRN
ncbi:NFX1-type zinc finger-containing protein 1 [Mizuhopecten yessoensis]|uniref:NFX1-type zinc finger-containing protein 1 n=1 Tax=Mizuhopecten yessoensis TaxID=6573 RepID=A0A210PHK8_MIZYE|nr:NFX1-type zinc finger-containing protein 1 [Mizuhopecten yessoensis]